MNKRSSAPARVLATLALVAGVVVAIVVIGSAGGGDDSTTSERQGRGDRTTRTSSEERRTPATYVVQSGDTLTSIARENGVSVARIQMLNPGVDPQILISGETLKLR
jgi:LysM repeat protein